MAPGGVLEVDNSLRASSGVESHDCGPLGKVIDYGRLQPNRGSVGEVPAMCQMEVNECLPTLPDQGNRGEVRAVRQMEITRHLRATQRKMDQLTSEGGQPASDRVPTPGPSRQEMELLRNQMQELQNTIEQMRNQQQSDWALDLSDEPPPAYD
jgi:hypothetical protein